MDTLTSAARTGSPARVADVVAEVEAERAAVARLLHDEVAQSLLAARFAADLAGAPDVADAVRAAISEVSAAMWRLRPRASHGDLTRALADLAERHREVVLVVRADGVPVLKAEAATVAYRVVQAVVEACDASTVDVRVEVRSGTLTVSVSDDGRAYDEALHSPESDLTRWLARAGLLGGRARVGDGYGGGTTVFLEIPDALPEGDA
jgi:signal transduction histidine kinase